MTRTEEATPDAVEPASAIPDSARAAARAGRSIESNEPRNLVVLVLHQILLRVGWIFKTETVIMPAFLDMVGGTGWLRGFLPVLSRFGQSVPPMIFSQTLRGMRLKTLALCGATTAMGIPFLVLSAAWWMAGGVPQRWMAVLFLVCYAICFVCVGLANLSNGTVQGKLIRPNHRGRLLAASAILGSTFSIIAAMFLLGRWLETPATGFVYIFAFTGSLFVLAGFSVLALKEPRGESQREQDGMVHYLKDTWITLRSDLEFRRLARVVMLFATALMMFPHYQALGQQRLGITGASMMIWVVTQTASVGVATFLVGFLADRRGNRIAVRTLVFGTAVAPLLAFVLAWIGSAGGAAPWFWLIFIPLGLTPVTIKFLMNYTLEIADPHEHPRYLSATGLCLAAPFVLSPLVGLLVDLLGFEVVFLSGALLILLGGCLTFRLIEPRHHDRSAGHTVSVADD